ncbi:MAG: hypothetical protein WAM69_05190 [Candidatus Sulfotelmatobacter sp.]
MRRIVGLGLLLALAAALISCSGASRVAPALMPNIAGSWEFILTSATQPGYSTGLEVALQEGQSLDTDGPGYYVYTGQLSASGQQLNFVGLTPTGGVTFGGNCPPAVDNTGNSLTGSISGLGGSMNFTFTENGNVFNVTAALDASGASIDSGTYSAQSGSACNDSGTIIGGIVPKLSGTYTGQICQPLDSSCGTQDNATVTLSESGTTLTANILLTGADNTSFSVAGPVTGNEFSVQGTFQGTTIAYYGYYELTHDAGTGVDDLPSLYLVNTANPSQRAGLLTVQQTP